MKVCILIKIKAHIPPIAVHTFKSDYQSDSLLVKELNIFENSIGTTFLPEKGLTC